MVAALTCAEGGKASPMKAGAGYTYTRFPFLDPVKEANQYAVPGSQISCGIFADDHHPEHSANLQVDNSPLQQIRVMSMNDGHFTAACCIYYFSVLSLI